MPERRDPVAEAEEAWESLGWEGGAQMAATSTLLRAQQIVLARMSTALRPFGLTTSRFETLLSLYFSTDHELPLARTSERLQVHLSSIVKTIDRLVADGLVERRQHPLDRRTTLARLTPAGAELTTRAAQAVIEIRHGLGDLDLDDVRAITAALTTLRDDAAAFPPQIIERADPAAGS